MGFPVLNFSRMFFQYATSRSGLRTEPVLQQPDHHRRNRSATDSLLLDVGGQRTISKVVPSFVHNTIDSDLSESRPANHRQHRSRRSRWQHLLHQAARRVVQLWKTSAPVTVRRARPDPGRQALRRHSSAADLRDAVPRRRASVRGFDIRSIGPRDLRTGLVLGGNKSLLFNASVMITIAGPVRLILFYDAGRSPNPRSILRDVGRTVRPSTTDAGARPVLHRDPHRSERPLVRPPRLSASGVRSRPPRAEIRFFMPVLNVPFRLIFALGHGEPGSRTTAAGAVLPVPVRGRLDVLTGGRSRGFRARGFTSWRVRITAGSNHTGSNHRFESHRFESRGFESRGFESRGFESRPFKPGFFGKVSSGRFG